MAKRVTIVHGTSSEWLEEAIRNGILEGEAKRKAVALIEENRTLKKENRNLRMMLIAKSHTISNFRRISLDAIESKNEAKEADGTITLCVAGCVVSFLATMAILIIGV